MYAMLKHFSGADRGLGKMGKFPLIFWWSTHLDTFPPLWTWLFSQRCHWMCAWHIIPALKLRKQVGISLYSTSAGYMLPKKWPQPCSFSWRTIGWRFKPLGQSATLWWPKLNDGVWVRYRNCWQWDLTLGVLLIWNSWLDVQPTKRGYENT